MAHLSTYYNIMSSEASSLR